MTTLWIVGGRASDSFGEALRKLRTDRGGTMREMGARIGVPASRVCMWEHGEGITMRSMVKLIEAYKVKVELVP